MNVQVLGLSVILAILGAAPVAAPTVPESLTVDLVFETGPESRPHYLCILSETGVLDATGDPRNSLSLELEELTDGAFEGAQDGVWQIRPPDTFPSSLTAKLARRPALEAALRSMAVHGKNEECGNRPELCSAGFESRLKLKVPRRGGRSEERGVHVFCAGNTWGVEDGQAPRTAVVLFSKLAHSPAAIERMHLQGTTATLTLTAPIDASKPIAATVVGGHYIPSRTERISVGTVNAIRLPLKPRCRRHQLDVGPMPEGAPATLDLEWRPLAGPSKLSCNAHVKDDKVAIDLPVAGLLDPSLAISIGEQPSRPFATLDAFLPDGEPPPVIGTRLRDVAFGWQRHCLYSSSGACPQADVGDARFRCEQREGDRETCSYVCSRRSGALVLPSRVHFEGGDGDRWTDVLSHAGQTLEEYVPPHDRTLALDFKRWQSPPISDSEKELIQRVDVLLPGIGEPLRVPMRSSLALGRLRVRVPGLECTDVVEYDLVTRRQSSRQVVRAGTGTVEVARPEDLTSRWLTGITLWTGYSRPISYPDVYGSSGDELSFPDNVMFTGEVSLRRLPWNQRWFAEGSYGYVIGKYEYRTPESSNLLDGVWYQRHMLSLAGGHQLRSWLAIMGVVRGIYGNPLTSGNGDFAPTNQFSFRGGPRVELWRGTHGAFAFEYTAGLNEKVHTVRRSDPSSPPQLFSKERREHGWLLLGYRFNLR